MHAHLTLALMQSSDDDSLHVTSDGHAAHSHGALPFSHLGYRGERHGQWTSGAARAGVFGMSDGLVSNLSLVAGVAGATSERSDVLIGGIAGLVAGAMSMAVGEYVSMKANQELLERELEVERREIAIDPIGETRELAGIYVERGIDQATALDVASQLMRDPEIALQAHAREELGVDPDELGSPIAAAAASFLAFAVGASIPIIPWIFGSGTAAMLVSLAAGVLVALALGGGLARLTRRPIVRGALRQAGLLFVAFMVTTLIGRMIGGVV